MTHSKASSNRRCVGGDAWCLLRLSLVPPDVQWRVTRAAPVPPATLPASLPHTPHIAPGDQSFQPENTLDPLRTAEEMKAAEAHTTFPKLMGRAVSAVAEEAMWRLPDASAGSRPSVARALTGGDVAK